MGGVWVRHQELDPKFMQLESSITRGLCTLLVFLIAASFLAVAKEIVDNSKADTKRIYLESIFILN